MSCDYTIVKANAAPTYNASRGWKKSRLQLFNEPDSAFWIAIDSIHTKEPSKSSKPVLKCNGKWVVLDPKSLRRLLYDVNKVQELLASGSFEDHLKKNYQRRAQACKTFTTIQLGKYPTGLLPEQLMKLIKRAQIQLQLVQIFSHLGKQYIVRREKEIFEIPQDAYKKSQNTVYKITDLVTRRRLAFKHIHDADQKAFLQNEFDVSDDLHIGLGPTIGIQHQPLDKVLNADGKLVGKIDELYEGDYLDYMQKNPVTYLGNVLNEFAHILAGMVLIHRKGYAHRDIKPENILFTGTTLHIADFGGAVKDPKTLYYTAHYAFERELQEISNNEDKLKREQQRDMFGIGYIFFLRLEGKAPYERDENNKFLKPAKPVQYQIGFIQNMLHPNPLLRPTAEEALKMLIKFHPKISKEIAGLCQL